MDRTDHTVFMKEAIRLAQEAASAGEVPIGALVVHQGVIIGQGRNTREMTQDATGHAEMEAIRTACRARASWRLNDCDLYVTLEPCLMCAGAMIQARISRLFFGAYDPKSGMAGSVFDVFSLPANHRLEVEGGLLEEGCGQLLRDFFEARRNPLC